jgi:predicted TIM-barrel fold metal-dependent hydrolase
MTVSIVDIHSHLYPRSYVELLKTRTAIPKIVGDPGDERFVIFPEEDMADASGGRPMSPDFWDVGRKIAFMDRHGIDQTVISLGNPWLDPFDRSESLTSARDLNAELADLPATTGGRIFAMGVLPTGVADAAEIVGEIADHPGLVGVVSGPRLCGLTFDDERLEPVWTALARTGLPWLVHPHTAAAVDELAGFGHAFPVSMGFPFETTIAVARLVFAGVLVRHRGLRVVASHGGGTLPYLAARLDAGWASDGNLARRLPNPPSADLARLYLDAVLYHERAMHAAADLVGVEKLAFGTDHPFSVADPEANLAAIESAFSPQDQATVLEGTARTLFGLHVVVDDDSAVATDQGRT